METRWDPGQYLTYVDERARPFHDLLARVPTPARSAHEIVDLGCGAGNLTALLAERWPGARVTGLDTSVEMLQRARADHPGLAFEQGDVRTWVPAAPVDVLVSNAVLQWVPDHLALLPTLLDQLAPGGVFAAQIPGSHVQPSHTVMTELAAEPAYAPHTRDAATITAHAPATYLHLLTSLGWRADVWETTYLHGLEGEDPVFTWLAATGARPTLQALPDELRPGFEAELRRRLREAYPPREYADRQVTVLDFRRIFLVATTAGG